MKFVHGDEDGEESEFREHLLIYSGFIGASSLTAIIFAVSFPNAFEKLGSLDIVLGVLGLAFSFSTFAGLGILVSLVERRKGHDPLYVDAFVEVSTLFSGIMLVTFIPTFIAPISESLTLLLDIGILALVVCLFALVYLSRHYE